MEIKFCGVKTMWAYICK